jgi:hypothetical protein
LAAAGPDDETFFAMDKQAIADDEAMNVYLERFDVPPLKEPPADYRSWELNPGIFDVIEHQEMYLSNCTL